MSESLSGPQGKGETMERTEHLFLVKDALGEPSSLVGAGSLKGPESSLSETEYRDRLAANLETATLAEGKLLDASQIEPNCFPERNGLGHYTPSLEESSVKLRNWPGSTGLSPSFQGSR